MKFTVGVDLGGTNIRAAALDEKGQLVGERFQEGSRGREGQEAVLTVLKSIIRKAMDSVSSGTLVGIGVAVPGHVDPHRGIVKWSPNLGQYRGDYFEMWKDVPLSSPLNKEFGVPTFIGNDANLAALGEYQFGSGKGNAKCLVMLTLGTGIGSGIVLSSQAVQGKAVGPLILIGGNGGGGELGHTCIHQGGLMSRAGLYGTVESYCQIDSIVERAVSRIKNGHISLIEELVEEKLENVSPRTITEAAQQGDLLAQEVLSEIGKYLGVAVGNCINTFAPDVLAIGGQISKSKEWLMRSVIKEARNVAIRTLFNDAKIVLAEQGEDAGILGASALAFQNYSSQ